MKTVRFIDGGRWGYRCTLPGDQSGEYVPAETARALARALKQLVDAAQCKQIGDYARAYAAAEKALADAGWQEGGAS